MPRFSTNPMTASRWLSLAWVYSAALWVLLLVGSLSAGWMGLAALAALRLAGTLAIGIGLCAGERWAWANAVCLALFEGGAAATLALFLNARLAALPAGTFSVQRVHWDLMVFQLRQAVQGAGAVVLLWIGVGALLWRLQDEYDIPHRRPFTTLAQQGLWLSLPMVAVDALLFTAWCMWAARS
jgi:hypothetical protein